MSEYIMTSHARLTVALHTLGCKLNQAETESIGRHLVNSACCITSENTAQIVVLNTCTVTAAADRKARQWLRRVHRQNPQAIVIATGCYAQRAPQELARTGSVNYIFNNTQKNGLPGFIIEQRYKLSHPVRPSILPSHYRTRAMVKIQDGCRGYCSYCIVPKVRTPEFSISPDRISAEITSLVNNGYCEIVLTGTEIGSYQYEDINLAALVKIILSQPGLRRLHLSSLQPQEVTPDLIELWRDPRLCRHFHIALQSGSDLTLERMQRRYTTNIYRNTLNLIRSNFQDVTITTDVIVGFPGETESAFKESYQLCKSSGFAAIHVFSFSPRPGTSAALMIEQVPEHRKRERELQMLRLSREMTGTFQQHLIGKEYLVLWEGENPSGSGVFSGLTDNYVRVFTKNAACLTNSITLTRLTGRHGQGLWGELAVNAPVSYGLSSTTL